MGNEVPSKAALKALRRAAGRPRGNISPIFEVRSAASQTKMVNLLLENGWARMEGRSPIITDAGRKVAARTQEQDR